MKTIENQTLDVVNVGLGLVNTGRATVEEAYNRTVQAVADARTNVEKAWGDLRTNVGQGFEDLKVKGALDNSPEAQKLREAAVGAARRFA